MLRFAARGLLSSYFLADGLNAALNPESQMDEAGPAAEVVTQYANRYLPTELAAYIPTDTETVVRLSGGVQALGALMLATGIGRRTGAFVVALSYLPKVIAARRHLPSDDRLRFCRELSLLGGALLAGLEPVHGGCQRKPAKASAAPKKPKPRLSKDTP